MNSFKTLLVVSSMVCWISSAGALHGADLRASSMSAACTKLSGFMAKADKRKLAVMDIVGVDGRITELGKTLAEEFIVEFFANDKLGFVIVDRSNLNRLLEEQKRAAEGALRPDDTKKLKELGRLTGADAFLFGTIAEVGEQFQITFKIIATDNAEIVGAARMNFPKSEDVQVLNQNSQRSADDVTRGRTASDKKFAAKSSVWKSGSLEARLENFLIDKAGEATATVRIKNNSKQETLYLCANGTNSTYPRQIYINLRDSSGLKLTLSEQDGLTTYCGTPSGYQSILHELHFNQTGTLDQMPRIGAGQETIVTLRFKAGDESSAAVRDNNYRLSLDLIYLFSSGKPRSAPQNGTAIFEDIRPH